MTSSAAGPRARPPDGSGPPAGNRRGRDTRRRILEVAAARFEVDGIDLTLDDVARDARTTRMTVHRHTGGREALLTHLVLRASVAVADDIARILDTDLPLADRLTDALVGTVARIRAAPHLLGLFTGGDLTGTWPSLDPDARVLGAVHAFFLPYLREAEVAGELRAGTEESVDWMLRQVLLLLVLPDAAPDEAAVRHQIRTFVVPALLPGAAGGSAPTAVSAATTPRRRPRPR